MSFISISSGIALASAIAFARGRARRGGSLLVNTMFSLAPLRDVDAQFTASCRCWSTPAPSWLFLFVVMLLNLGHPSELADMRGRVGSCRRINRARTSGEIMVIARTKLPDSRRPPNFTSSSSRSSTPSGRLLSAVQGYLLAFELTSVLSWSRSLERWYSKGEAAGAR